MSSCLCICNVTDLINAVCCGGGGGGGVGGVEWGCVCIVTATNS